MHSTQRRRGGETLDLPVEKLTGATAGTLLGALLMALLMVLLRAAHPGARLVSTQASVRVDPAAPGDREAVLRRRGLALAGLQARDVVRAGPARKTQNTVRGIPRRVQCTLFRSISRAEFLLGAPRPVQLVLVNGFVAVKGHP